LGLVKNQRARTIRMRRTPPPVAPPIIAQLGPPFDVFEEAVLVAWVVCCVADRVLDTVTVEVPLPPGIIVVVLTLKRLLMRFYTQPMRGTHTKRSSSQTFGAVEFTTVILMVCVPPERPAFWNKRIETPS
jgi:hypothetical protein